MNAIVKIFLISVGLLAVGCNNQSSSTSSVSTRTPGSSNEEVAPRLTEDYLQSEIPSIFSSDPLAKYQWHLFNVGQTNFAKYPGRKGKDINGALSIIQQLTGRGVKIAVSDRGVELNHEDLKDNALLDQSKNYALNTNIHPDWYGDPMPSGKDPASAHGTQVAGIISMKAGNGVGGRGVAPESKVAGLRYIGEPVRESMTLDQTQGDFDIFNYSYGKNQCMFYGTQKSLVRAYIQGVTKLRDGLGALYVKAAGNDYKGILKSCLNSSDTTLATNFYGNTNLEDMNAFPYTILVSSVNATGNISSFSTPGPNIWIAAPGGSLSSGPALMTSDLSGCDAGVSAKLPGDRYSNAFEYGHTLNKECKYTSRMTGTSAATPVVSGAIALLLEANPNLTWRDVKHILASTATKIDVKEVVEEQPNRKVPALKDHKYQQSWVVNSAGYSFHNWFGFGALNIDKAVQMAKSYTSSIGDLVKSFHPRTFEPNYTSGALALTIPDRSAKGVTHSIVVKHNLTIESVRIELSSDHKKPRELGVELTSPSGTKSILLNVNSGIKANFITKKVLGSNAFYGEPSKGKWTIKVIDGEEGNTGKLTDWKIGVYGHAPTNSIDETPPNPVERIYNDTYFRSSRSTPPFSWKASDSEDVLRYEYSIGSAPGLSDIFGWNMAPNDRVVQLNATADRVRFRRNQEYFINVRVIDQSENRSTVTTSKWTTSRTPSE